MIRTVLLASTFAAAMLAWSAPASARWLSVVEEVDCAFCAPRYVVVETDGASRYRRVRTRGEIVAMYPQPYTRYDIEGIRVLERMR